MLITVLVAWDENRLIGKGNDLPWYFSEDLQLFKKRTMGNVVVMGRNTYDSIGKPLSGRANIVLTNRPVPLSLPLVEDTSVWTAQSVDEAVIF